MHVSEMEAEARKLRLFTDSRFKSKSEQYNNSVKAIEEQAKLSIEKVQQVATEAKDAVQYKLDDFKIQLESRVTKEYVEVIGK